jgi:hypothetical protein
MRTTLKAPGTKRLKLKYDDPLSNSAFKFNLRRYYKVQRVEVRSYDVIYGLVDEVGRRCRLTVSKPVLKSPTVVAALVIIS